MSFDEVFNSWYGDHLKRRGGENKRRLMEGMGHESKLFLQKVWWYAFSHFDDLHPEYELADFRDGKRYLDFAYVRDDLRLAIEIDGWHVLRFSYDYGKTSPACVSRRSSHFSGRVWDVPGRLR